MKKTIAVIVLLCLAGLSFVSAGGTKESASGKMELTFYYPINVGGPLAGLIEKMCSDFTAENPNITIKPVYTGNYDDTVNKIQADIQARTPPDFFINLATQRFSMAASRAAIPLDDLISSDPEGKTYINDFLSGFMEDSWVDGKIYSIPFQRSTMIIYYNKDAFAEVGLDPEKPPTNWRELVDYSQRLVKKDAAGNVTRYGVGLALNSGSAQWGFTGFCLQNSADGRNLMSDDGKKVYFDTPENIEALQFWLDLQNRYGVMQKGIVQWTDLPGQFLNGQVAIIYHTTGNLTNINNNAKFKFGTAFLPGSKRVAAPTGGGNFFISEGISRARQEAAWKFIKFVTSPQRAAQWSIDTGYVATRKSAIDSRIMQDYYAKLPQARVAFDQIPLAKPELTTYNAAQIWRIFNDAVQAAVTGERTAAQALRNAQTQAEEALRRFQ